MGEVTQAITLLQRKLLVNQGEALLSQSNLQSSSLVNQSGLPADQSESLVEKSTSQGKQQVDQSLAQGAEWNVYLHHPRGTIERIAGPFPNKEQAETEMSSQADFGLFPESKGYRWECREEPEETA